MAPNSIPPRLTSRAKVTYLLRIQVHTIQCDIQGNSYPPATHPGPYHPMGHPGEQLLHLLHIQVHTIQRDIQRNSYSPATHPGPYHTVGHPEEQLLTSYTSRSIPSCGTSRGTVTHLLHIQVHTIQWDIHPVEQWDIQRNSYSLHIQVHSIK